MYLLLSSLGCWAQKPRGSVLIIDVSFNRTSYHSRMQRVKRLVKLIGKKSFDESFQSNCYSSVSFRINLKMLLKCKIILQNMLRCFFSLTKICIAENISKVHKTKIKKRIKENEVKRTNEFGKWKWIPSQIRQRLMQLISYDDTYRSIQLR
jgi:hypothetical protein